MADLDLDVIEARARRAVAESSERVSVLALTSALDVPGLVAEVRRLRAERDAARAELSRRDTCACCEASLLAPESPVLCEGCSPATYEEDGWCDRHRPAPSGCACPRADGSACDWCVGEESSHG